MEDNKIVLQPDAKGGVSITPPQGCEVDKAEVIDGVLTVTFKPQERKLPKSWEEFCEMYPKCGNSFYIDESSEIKEVKQSKEIRFLEKDKNIIPDAPTAKAVLALCQLIQLRDCYNQGWVPKKDEPRSGLYIMADGSIGIYDYLPNAEILQFPNPDLRVEFLNNFRPLIEKLKPLYGIKEGGEE